MPTIFGRESNAPHGALGLLAEELQRSEEALDRALGWNLAHDDRVSEARAAHFYEFTGFPSSAGNLKEALARYVKEWLAVQPPNRTYLSPDNANNIVPRQPDFLLCHVLNASSLLHRIRVDGPSFGIDPEPFRAAEVTLEFPINQDEATALIDNLFGAGFVLQRNRPVFAASWANFEEHAASGEPDSWNRAVGVWRRENSTQLVLRYPASIVGTRAGASHGQIDTTLVRPTQLDAGNYAYHYPSPAALPVERGGFAMSLRDLSNIRNEAGRPRKLPLVSEYIHAPFRFEIEDWLGFDWIGLSGTSAADPSEFRGQHRERLDQERL